MSARNAPGNPHHPSSPSRTRARSMSTSDAVDLLAASAGEGEGQTMVLFPSPSVGHFCGLQTVNSGEEVDGSLPTLMPPSAERQDLLMMSATEAHPLLLQMPTENPDYAAPAFPFDRFENDAAASSSSGPPSLSSRSAVSRNNSSTLSSSDHLSASDGAAPSSFTQNKRQRSHRRRLQMQQQQQPSSSSAFAAVPSTSTAPASSTSSRAQNVDSAGGGPSLRASLDAGMAAMRNWIRSHRQLADPSTSAPSRAPPRTGGGREESPDDDSQHDDDLFPTIFELEEPDQQQQQQEPQSPWSTASAHRRSHRQRQRTRSEPDSAGLQEYFLLPSVLRRRRANTADERGGDDGAISRQRRSSGSSPGGDGRAAAHRPLHHSPLATPPRPRSLFLQPHPRGGGPGERLSSSAAAALSWPAAAATVDGGGTSSEPHRRQLSLDAQQMMSLLTPPRATGTPDATDPFARNDGDDLFPSGVDDGPFSRGDVTAGSNRSLLPALEAAAMSSPSSQTVGLPGMHRSLHQNQQQNQSRPNSLIDDGSGSGRDAEAAPRQAPEHTFSAEDARERDARLRWIRINRRFQVVITVVALGFSVVLFAILLCWVVLTSTYVVSLDKPCDVNLKAYFWLVSLQLVLDVFRSDILRFVFRWDSESADRIPCRVVAYNMVYLLYALLVLRLGILSVYAGNPTCRSTAPELFKASTAFVSLSLLAWAIILFGYVVPLFVVAGLLTYNGYNPTEGDGRLPAGGGPTAVFPSAYSTGGAPPSCIEQMERVSAEEVRGQECCICMEALDKGDAVVRTPCQHCFHRSCCREWLRQARTCPVCRSDIPSALSGSGGTDPGSDHPGAPSSSSTLGGSGGDGPSRIPLGPTGRPVRGLFLRMFRRRGSSGSGNGGRDTPSPPPPAAPPASSVSSFGVTGARGGGSLGGIGGVPGAVDLELGLAPSVSAPAALSPRSRYASASSGGQ